MTLRSIHVTIFGLAYSFRLHCFHCIYTSYLLSFSWTHRLLNSFMPQPLLLKTFSCLLYLPMNPVGKVYKYLTLLGLQIVIQSGCINSLFTKVPECWQFPMSLLAFDRCKMVTWGCLNFSLAIFQAISWHILVDF